MNRLLLLVLAVVSLGGFALGWLAFAPRPDGAPPSSAPAVLTHRFPLLAADMTVDRETPAVAVDARGRLLLAWASQTGDAERTLWLARSADGGAAFDEPVAFRKVPVHSYTSTMKGKEVTRTTSVAPRLAASGNAVFLAWTEAVGGGPGVAFLVARSDDGGRTFADPVRAHGADAARPGFTALSATADGIASCAWLDSRQRGQKPFCSASRPGGGEFLPEALAYAGPAGGGGICPCCDADVLRTTGGETFVAFRDNDDDNRDICVVRNHGGAAFDPPVQVNRERWQFNGCPHDGPSLAVSRGRLHVVWMDAHDGRRRVYHAGSALADLHFDPRPLSPDAPGKQGHPKLAADANGSLHVVWDDSLRDEPASPTADGHGEHQHAATASGRAVMYARADGDGFGPARALDPQPGAAQVNPSLAVGPAGDVFVVWNELTEDGKSVAFVRVPAAPR